MQRISTSNDHGRSGVWFGGLLSPEAYLIATQQATAQANAWSLEELELKFEFNPSEEEIQKALDEQTGFIISGLSIESAEYDAADARVKLTGALATPLPTTNLRWVRVAAQGGDAGGAAPGELVELPVYLNRARKQLLCSVSMPTYGLPPHTWYQRGVALFANV